MSKELRTRLFVVFGVLLAAVFFAFPVEKIFKLDLRMKERINLGLDLKGGMHLTLKVETEKLDDNAGADAVIRAIEILRNRIDGMGVAEPVIQRQGENEIIVQLPGVTDRESALRMVGQVAQLEFKLVYADSSRNVDIWKKALAGDVPAGYILATIKGEDSTPVLIEEKVSLSGERVKDAFVDLDTQGFGEPRISLSFDAAGGKEFANLTRQHVGERLAIVLDGEVLSAPNIREPILTGTGEISGQFTFEEASLLALSLRSGSLPAPMHIEEERTIGPLLGKDSIVAGIKAAVVGISILFAFMTLYYRTAGIISIIALLMNLLLILGTMGFLNYMLPDSQVTLTLPGIAGIILTLGMAVDANVLINERIREEIENGRPLHAAVNNGFTKAFSAIFDSNLTTLIAAFMLFQFGSGPIKGFAVTLSLGLITSLFTALFVSRTIFMLLLQMKALKNLKMMRLLSNTKINFFAKTPIFIAVSVILLIAGMVNLVQKGDAAYGIDFAGGQIQEYQFAKPVDTQQVRDSLTAAGVGDAIIQRFEQKPQNVIIRTSDDTYQKVSQALKERLSDNPFEILRIEKVGPVVGKALREAAMLAIVCALAGILVYVGFRFKHFDFATGGVVALLHDVVITLGVLVLLGRQIDLLVVTALLTIAGYSINDTIVIYDRVRENSARLPKMPLKDRINLSLNQTLGRTLLTTLATMLVVLPMYFIGGQVLNTFALTMIIGFVAGTYSTIFIVSPIVLALQKKMQPSAH